MTDVFVLGTGLAAAARRRDDVRLEELVYRTVSVAMVDAGVSRGQLDNVTLGASDELDGRPISSMLLAAPAGAFLTDEIRVTDSGLTALCLAVARHASGDFGLGLVVSWCKASKTDVASVMNARAEPFFIRDLGLTDVTADAFFGQAVKERFGISDSELVERVRDGYRRARANPRGLRSAVPSSAQVAKSDYWATPIREMHCALATDGAACLVIASPRWVARHRPRQLLARITGVGWASDEYRLSADRLVSLRSAHRAWKSAMRMAGEDVRPDVVELECPTAFHEAAFARCLDLGEAAVSPSGGLFAQNPLLAAGLVNAVEAVLQVSSRAGGVQVTEARRAVAHSCHGFAQQSNAFVVIDRVEEDAA